MNRVTTIGAMAVSILALLAFGAALGLAYWKGDSTSISLLVGAIVANSSTVVSFWLGSSTDKTHTPPAP